MITGSVWIIKLILAHLISDFIFQPKTWVENRAQKHFASGKLYLHGTVTGITAFLMVGPEYWLAVLVITATHILIDGWKSFQKPSIGYFIADQLLHLLVIFICWYFIFSNKADIIYLWEEINGNENFWKIACAFIFVTAPAGILTGLLTKKWRDKIEDGESLANAGKWIGMIERVIILVFVLQNQYSAIGLLVTAKGIIRFNEKDRPEIKTEYLVIGTLISIVMSILTGTALKL